jgi:hypothetical protein
VPVAAAATESVANVLQTVTAYNDVQVANHDGKGERGNGNGEANGHDSGHGHGDHGHGKHDENH